MSTIAVRQCRLSSCLRVTSVKKVYGVQKAFELIKSAKHIVFASHINPDTDTLGSAIGMMLSLAFMQKHSSLYNVGSAPISLSFLPQVDALTQEFPQDCDLVISFDCANKERLHLPMGDYKIINIDHHASNTLYGDENIVNPLAPSAASVVLEFLDAIGVKPTKEAATCLYAALADDTGFFQYGSLAKKLFLDAAYLIECGAEAPFVTRCLTQKEPLSKIKLHSSILSTLEMMANGKLAFLYMTREALKTANANEEEADGVVETARSIDGVEVGLFLRELENGDIRGSLRSKTAADVDKIAAIFGGGGHIRAAGFTLKNDREFIAAAKMVALKIEQALEQVNG